MKFVGFWLIVKDKIDVKHNAILFFYSEALCNHIIVKFFKKKNAKIFNIEDGGFATYIPYANYKNSLKLKNLIQLVLVKLIPGLHDTRLVISANVNLFFFFTRSLYRWRNIL